jgi:hypothetical protein
MRVEKSCLDCSAYLPASATELTDYGICLNDEALDPFVEELLEDVDSASCRALVEEKKFIGDRPTCQDFQESECIEIDDNSPLGQELRRLADKGELIPERLESALLEERVRQIDWKTVPVNDYTRRLRSENAVERNAAINSLGGLISFGNQAAFEILFGFLAALAPPRTVEEIHLRVEILRTLDPVEDKTAVAAHLIEELHRTPSNNTTRQWISAIFRFLEGCPYNVIQEPLETMLSDRRFSPKFRKKIDETLSRSLSRQQAIG